MNEYWIKGQLTDEDVMSNLCLETVKATDADDAVRIFKLNNPGALFIKIEARL